MSQGPVKLPESPAPLDPELLEPPLEPELLPEPPLELPLEVEPPLEPEPFGPPLEPELPSPLDLELAVPPLVPELPPELEELREPDPPSSPPPGLARSLEPPEPRI